MAQVKSRWSIKFLHSKDYICSRQYDTIFSLDNGKMGITGTLPSEIAVMGSYSFLIEMIQEKTKFETMLESEIEIFINCNRCAKKTNPKITRGQVVCGTCGIFPTFPKTINKSS